jgi:transcriptional regulator with XRE-family HTH domain
MNSDDLRLILGVKLKQLRQEKGYTLKEFAEKANLSFSYLSEIEAGKKYPKPEKIIELAKALNIAVDELISTKVDDRLNSLTALLDSPLIREFPFQFFGIAPREVVHLITHSPQEAGALIRTFLEVGQSYDVRVEQFLFAALRSYQKMHHNYFEDLENAAAAFIAEHRWPAKPAISLKRLKTVLTQEYGCILDDAALHHYPELRGFRSIWLDGKSPRLLLNPKLLPAQKAFILGREIGYHYLGLKERAVTSSWLKVESFAQVLNNFKARIFPAPCASTANCCKRIWPGSSATRDGTAKVFGADAALRSHAGDVSLSPQPARAQAVCFAGNVLLALQQPGGQRHLSPDQRIKHVSHAGAARHRLERALLPALAFHQPAQRAGQKTETRRAESAVGRGPALALFGERGGIFCDYFGALAGVDGRHQFQHQSGLFNQRRLQKKRALLG